MYANLQSTRSKQPTKGDNEHGDNTINSQNTNLISLLFCECCRYRASSTYFCSLASTVAEQSIFVIPVVHNVFASTLKDEEKRKKLKLNKINIFCI